MLESAFTDHAIPETHKPLSNKMPEIKIIPKRFASVATSVPATPVFSLNFYASAIHNWRPSTDKVKVFGKPIELVSGVSYVKSKNPRPTLREVFEDHYGTNRSPAPLVLSVPYVAIRPVCVDIYEYADKKKMALAWAFSAKTSKEDAFPSIFGLSPSVVKILSQETPEDILFDEPEVWVKWMADWIKRYMLAHRIFDATDMGVVDKIPIVIPVDPISLVAIATVKAVEIEKQKRGRKKKTQ